MSATETSIAAIVNALESACDQRWAVWLSDTGQWWATWHNVLPAAAMNAGCVPFLRADRPEALGQRIREQDQLAVAPTGMPKRPPVSTEKNLGSRPDPVDGGR